MSEAIAVQPAAGRHAIEVMALAVEWGRHLSGEHLALIEELYRASPELQKLLPSLERVHGVSLQFGGDGMTVTTPEVGGLQLTQLGDNGTPAWTLNVGPELVACNCLVYDRWETVKPKALEILRPIIERVAELGYPIPAVGLQYQDSFRVGASSPCEATKRLFREGNNWLSPHAWKMDGSWHIYQGWFSAAETGHRVHNLLNIDFIAEAQSGLIRINGQHRAQAVSMKGEQLPYALSEISGTLDQLHLDNKSALHHLLSDNVCSQIGLTLPEKK